MAEREQKYGLVANRGVEAIGRGCGRGNARVRFGYFAGAGGPGGDSARGFCALEYQSFVRGTVDGAGLGARRNKWVAGWGLVSFCDSVGYAGPAGSDSGGGEAGWGLGR